MSFLKELRVLMRTPRLVRAGARGPQTFYELLGDDVIEGESQGFSDPNKALWLNLGYWDTARTYPEAAAALSCVLADAARLGPADELLDVGYGLAEQDFLWVERYGVKRIVGLNITPMHVERARERAKQRGLEDRVDLRLGSATDMGLPPASFDKVTALESAFHFDTRDRFFEEAFRVLRPGGRIALADGIPAPGSPTPSFTVRTWLKRWSVPLANMYDRDEYTRRLRAAGFENVEVRSIRNYVFPGNSKYSKLRLAGRSMNEAVIELSRDEIERCVGADQWGPTGLTDYVIATADKPR